MLLLLVLLMLITDNGKKAEDNPADIAKKKSMLHGNIFLTIKKKLADLKNTDEKKYSVLLMKVQERYEYLVSSGNTVEADQVAELVNLGLVVK